MTGIRAQGPPAAPPPFDPPKLCEGRRTAGHVQVPDPSTEDASGPLEMSWKMATAGVLEEPSPTKLRRTSSIAGNVLVAEIPGDNNKEIKAFWLQRKITEESHSRNYVRIGFPLQPVRMEGGENKKMANAWTVTKSPEGSMYPFEMVAIKVQKRNQVFPEEEEDDDTNKIKNSTEDGKKEEEANLMEQLSESSLQVNLAKNARNEIAALQLIKDTDPNGKGNVLSAQMVVDDMIDVYVIMPYCKEGTLVDLIGTSGNGRLEESVAKRYFCNILNGLETLQKVKLCHRNLCLENVLIRGKECLISSLGWSLRIPVSEDGNEMHLLEPQLACGTKPEYIPPEVFGNEAFDGFAADLWSTGVMLYLMLFGIGMLFSAPIPEDPRYHEICMNGNLKTVIDKFQALVPDQTPVSDEAIDLLQNMLRADPADRLTLAQVKDHPWVKAVVA